MKPQEYAGHDATALAELVRKGEVTARELASVALACAEALEGEVSALLATFGDDVEALSQDARPEGAFGGVPFIIKDCLLTMKGKPVLNGSRLCEGITATADTDLMRRFAATGVTVIGLSKSPEFGYNASTEPLITKPVRNPWQTTRSAGGSSGGSAAAVAARYVPFAHGNDGGGSIRIPASACGVVGLKPTRGRNPLGPDFGEALFGMSCEGVLSRSVRDTAGMLDCTAGPGVGDPYVIPPLAGSIRDLLERAPTGLSIAVAPAPAWAPRPEMGIADAVATAGRFLSDMGHNVEGAEPVYDVERLSQAISTAWVLGETAWIRGVAEQAGRTPGPQTLERVMWNIYREGMALGGVDAVSTILSGFNAACRNVGAFFQTYDFLVLPTVARLPLPLGHLDQNADLTSREWWDRLFAYIPYTPLFNVTGQPAVSLPLGQSNDGLPIGVQIVGRFGDEARLLQLARALEIACPWQSRSPAISALRMT